VLRHAAAPPLRFDDVCLVAAGRGGSRDSATTFAHNIIQRLVNLEAGALVIENEAILGSGSWGWVEQRSLEG
jgi:hypothetical protein